MLGLRKTKLAEKGIRGRIENFLFHKSAVYGKNMKWE